MLLILANLQKGQREKGGKGGRGAGRKCMWKEDIREAGPMKVIERGGGGG